MENKRIINIKRNFIKCETEGCKTIIHHDEKTGERYCENCDQHLQ